MEPPLCPRSGEKRSIRAGVVIKSIGMNGNIPQPCYWHLVAGLESGIGIPSWWYGMGYGHTIMPIIVWFTPFGEEFVLCSPQ
jgi:hypothetical protein